MKFVHLLIFATLILSGCNTLSSKAQPSKLEAYSLEQKLPKTSDTKAITIAAANVLQSQDFLIKSSDTEIGFISASKEIML